MADVRAKFYVTEVGRTGYAGKVVLAAVTRGEDNKVWSQATPSGGITLSIKNELAFEQFDVGDEFFVDFTRAPKGEEGMG